MHPLLLDIPTQFESERLIMRSYQAGDGHWYYAMSLNNRSHLKQFEVDNPVHGLNSEEDAEVLVRQFALDWATRSRFFLAAFEKTKRKFVCQIYIGVVNWDLPEFEIGYFADIDHEGRGYVSEAVTASLGFIFTELHAQRVRLECDDSNMRSQRVAERCGFMKEGHIRQNKRRSEMLLTGTLFYGMLQEEYHTLAGQSNTEKQYQNGNK